MGKKRIKLVLPIIILLCGCASHKEAMKVFGNASYVIEDPLYGEKVSLVDGAYRGKPLKVYYENKYTYGDFNHDGLKDGAAILGEITEGNQFWYFLAFLINDGHQLVHQASIYLDDRAIINSVSTKNDKVFIDLYVHRHGDCMAGPTKRVKGIYAYPGPGKYTEGIEVEAWSEDEQPSPLVVTK